MIDEDAFEAMHLSMRMLPCSGPEDSRKTLRIGMQAYINALPKPQMPFDQAALYRKMTDME